MLLSVTVLAILASCIVSFYCSPNIPIHFSGGQADQFVNKYIGLFLMPAIMIITLFIQRIYIQAAWLIYFSACLHLFLLYAALVY
ncbi:DUF1648 domain-containing protein [Paenibacillus sp. alder61]|nr:DUF1648 domain-containing protein [Paenibacillus sp. alder61]MCA1295187.1 DUF1648 domain-containing protein [Paenibacillus sp. alder61]